MEHKVEQCSATAHVDGAQGGVQGRVQDGAQDGAVQCCCPCRWYLWNTLPPSGSHAKWTRAAPVVIQISHQGKIFFSETSVMKKFSTANNLNNHKKMEMRSCRLGGFNPIIPSLFLNSIYPGGGKFAPPWFLRVLGGCGFNFW